jgi:hypothetical protein
MLPFVAQAEEMYVPESADTESNKLRASWFTYFRGWQYLHWFCSVYISGVSAVVASNVLPEGLAKNIVALTVAVVSAVYAAIGPLQRADAYRGAWIILNLDHLRSIGASPETIRAVETGESMIGQRPVAARNHDHQV